MLSSLRVACVLTLSLASSATAQSAALCTGACSAAQSCTAFDASGSRSCTYSTPASAFSVDLGAGAYGIALSVAAGRGGSYAGDGDYGEGAVVAADYTGASTSFVFTCVASVAGAPSELIASRVGQNGDDSAGGDQRGGATAAGYPDRSGGNGGNVRESSTSVC